MRNVPSHRYITQTVVVSLSRQIIERVPEEVNVASLPDGLEQMPRQLLSSARHTHRSSPFPKEHERKTVTVLLASVLSRVEYDTFGIILRVIILEVKALKTDGNSTNASRV